MNTPTILNVFQQHIYPGSLPSQATHPFASDSEKSIGQLQHLIQSAEQISQNLNAYSTVTISDSRSVSQLRDHAASTNTLMLVRQTYSFQSSSQTIKALRDARTGLGQGYGEDIPPDRSVLLEWCISRISSWGIATGMQSFSEPESEGRITVTLAGEVLVVDIEFHVDRQDTLKPALTVVSVKTSYGAEAAGSISLNAFLLHCIQTFCAAVQKEDDQQDALEARRLSQKMIEHFKYLMMLETLAKAEEGGTRWFVDIEQLCLRLESFAKQESEALAIASPQTPLDIFLLRSHALPLPNLTSPSTSFLTYLSPLAYLSLLRSSPPHSEPVLSLPQYDIPVLYLRKQLSKNPRPSGITIGTLSLHTSSAQHLSSSSATSRPNFPLVPIGADFDDQFPQTKSPAPPHYAWYLDFTENGLYPGVVMSQSKMREIEVLLNRSQTPENPLLPTSLGIRSWVDLLLNPKGLRPVERYAAVYNSPSAAHPPLELRLTTPQEPGFRLEKVRMHSVRELWGILEIVKEQCWLNEILNGCEWVPEASISTEPHEGLSVTQDDLAAALNGTLKPRSIPVSVSLPASTESLVDSMAEDSTNPRIVMTSPERPPMTGLIKVTVTMDVKMLKGVQIQVDGALGVDLKKDTLEEVCRRGGALGLAGRVWAGAVQS